LKSISQEKGVFVMENLSVRQRAKKAGIPLWRVAVAIGVSEPTLTRWLRFPLPAEKENRVIEAISRLEREIS
jgi:hypothetical protein